MQLVVAELPSGRTRKGVETAERILDAAEQLFAENGYTGTTLRDIAARAGLRNPSIYNHFDGKESLYLAVLERGLRPMLQLFTKLASAAAEGRGIDLRLVDGLLEVLAEHPKLPRLLQHEALAGGERLHAKLTEWVLPMFDQAGNIIAHGPSAKRWNREKSGLLVLALYNMIAGYFTMAPLYQLIRGEELLSREMLNRQRELLHEIIRLLFSEENAK
jgi:TetR/AcrR family transcriptional regulator